MTNYNELRKWLEGLDDEGLWVVAELAPRLVQQRRLALELKQLDDAGRQLGEKKVIEVRK